MRGLFNWLAQLAELTRLGVRTLTERKGSAAAAMFGIAGVVAVLVGVLSIAEGFRRVLVSSGDPATAVVMRAGADTEMTSFILLDDARLIAQAPGVLQGPAGPVTSAELFVVVDLPKRSTGTDANVPLRGVEPAALEVRPQLRLSSGRMFAWGTNEVIVGEGAAREFRGLDPGSELRLGSQTWRVVGIFAAAGTVAESEIWTDVTVLQGAYRRGNSFQVVLARLQSAAAFDRFKDALTSDPRLRVKVVRQSDYYAEQSTVIYKLVTSLGTLIAGLMGLGAVFGALNTMYTAVASRTREIATLRALGFATGPVVLSVLLESLLLAAIGGAAGGALAYFAFDGFRAATINWASFSQVAFSFDVSGSLLLRGLVYALVLGLVGGLLPAIRAARMPVAAALRAL